MVGPPDPPPEAEESSLRRAWRDLLAALRSFLFWLVAGTIGTLSAIVTVDFVNNGAMSRALVGSGSFLLGTLLTVVLFFVVIGIRTPYRQRNEARAGWHRAAQNLTQLHRERRAPSVLPYPEFELAARDLIDAGHALLSDWPEQPTRAEFYGLYGKAEQWWRDVSALLEKTHSSWRSHAESQSSSLYALANNPTATKTWVKERIKRLEELILAEP